VVVSNIMNSIMAILESNLIGFGFILLMFLLLIIYLGYKKHCGFPCTDAKKAVYMVAPSPWERRSL
jgi:hypothetical protein